MATIILFVVLTISKLLVYAEETVGPSKEEGEESEKEIFSQIFRKLNCENPLLIQILRPPPKDLVRINNILANCDENSRLPESNGSLPQIEENAIELTATILTSGYLRHDFQHHQTYYDPDEYCLYHSNKSHFQVKICPSNCDPGFVSEDDDSSMGSEKEACILKCCPPDQVVDFGNTSTSADMIPSCQNSGNFSWRPQLYSLESLDNFCISKIPEEGGKPKYRIQNLDDNFCRRESYYPGVALDLNDGHYLRESFRLLQTGDLVLRTHDDPMSLRPTWKPLKEVAAFCIDGIQNFDASKNALYTGDKSHQILWKVDLCTDQQSTDEVDLEEDGRPENKLDLRFLKDVSKVYVAANYTALIPLTMTLVAFALTWSIWKLQGWTIFSHILSLFIFNLCLGTSYLMSHVTRENEETLGCMVLGVGTHFFYLSTFLWLTVLSFDFWSKLKDIRPSVSNRSPFLAKSGLYRYLIYALISWGIPSIVVTCGLVLQNQYGDYGEDSDCGIILPNYGKDRCFLSSEAVGVYLYFILGFLIPCNLLFFIMTLRNLRHHQKKMKTAVEHKSTNSLSMRRLFSKLVIVMGVSLAFEFVSWIIEVNTKDWNKGLVLTRVVVDVLNHSGRALLLFVIFVCRGRTVSELKRRFFEIAKFVREFSHNWKKGGAMDKRSYELMQFNTRATTNGPNQHAESLTPYFMAESRL